MTLGMIWAQAHDRVIGRDGDLPWRLPEDLAHFRRTTASDAVVMGRTSWFALPDSYRPLPGRRNIVLSGDPDFTPEGAEVARSLEAALALLDGTDAWICGGARVYADAMPYADVLVVTDIDLDVDGDCQAPEIGPEWTVVGMDPADGAWREAKNGLRFRITTYRRA
ncbi:dihydrofolate reductase [Georgenia faecalis]|uniref:Dihydrofolate reductase n=1 Tax=Georgenia faecalis TaxID=2483799 RepID=A0ABV9D673_9MICO|nr:dihydrofolate reductase [Georgenia faecalis]